MNKLIACILFNAISLVCIAQNVGIGTSTPAARLHVADSSVLFTAPLILQQNFGTVPITGTGHRMMWVAAKAAFRAGYVSGNKWDLTNIGPWSLAVGRENQASAAGSIALGGDNLVTFSGDYGAAIGAFNVVSGSSATALGVGNTAVGMGSTAVGSGSYANALSSTAIGANNDFSGLWKVSEWVPTDPVLLIGNGQSLNNRSTALTVLKNGNVGIGTMVPQTRLHLVGGNAIIENSLSSTSSLYLKSGANNGLLLETTSNGSTTLGRIRTVQGGGAGAGISIRQNNYVGLGVIGDPEFPLHIHSGSDALSTSGIAFTHSGLGQSPGNGMKMGLQYPATEALQYGYIQWPQFLPFNLFQGNNARLSINPDGNISMGAPVAEARLHVQGATNATTIKASATGLSGYALHTQGRIKIENNGTPMIGRVLTSDAEGNASWQDLPPTSVINRLENNLNTLTLDPTGMVTLAGNHLFLRSGIAPPTIINPANADGSYFFWNAHRGAVRSGQFVFNQLRHDSIGLYSMALGQRVMAKNTNSIAIGKDARAVADLALAIGNNVEAASFKETVLGSYNLPYTPASTTAWNNNDRLFVLGNGSAFNNPGNALVVLKNGNTGFGINNPASAVHANSRIVVERPTGGAGTTSSIEWRSNGAYRGALGWDVNAARFFFYDGKSNTNTLFINNGRIGIQRDPTTNVLEVNGNASKSSAGDWLANSDVRLKKNIFPIESALDKILQLKGITYEWNDDKTGFERPAGFQYGFTAQNVQQVFPELVSTDVQGYLQTAYGTYDPVMVEAIRELVSKIEVLEKKIKAMECK